MIPSLPVIHWPPRNRIPDLDLRSARPGTRRNNFPSKNISLVVEPPSWKICSSNWIISPTFRGEHKTYLKPPPRKWFKNQSKLAKLDHYKSRSFYLDIPLLCFSWLFVKLIFRLAGRLPLLTVQFFSARQRLMIDIFPTSLGTGTVVLMMPTITIAVIWMGHRYWQELGVLGRSNQVSVKPYNLSHFSGFRYECFRFLSSRNWNPIGLMWFLPTCKISVAKLQHEDLLGAPLPTKCCNHHLCKYAGKYALCT